MVQRSRIIVPTSGGGVHNGILLFSAIFWILAGPYISLAATFRGVGDLTGGNSSSHAFAVSANGMVVVGESQSSNGNEAFRWTEAGGMVGLGDLDGGSFNSTARAVSADGSAVVGVGTSFDTADRAEAFRWTAATGMIGLGFLNNVNPLGFRSSSALGVSHDGSIVVGRSTNTILDVLNDYQGFRWQSGTMTALPSPPYFSTAYAVSPGGTIVVGDGVSANKRVPILWTETQGFTLRISDSQSVGSALAVSGTNLTVVGFDSYVSPNRNVFQAFGWTLADLTVKGLGVLPDQVNSAASAVSFDGSVIVGGGNFGSGSKPFIWDAINGLRDLQAVLQQQGADVAGWALERAEGISADGLTIVGTGINPSGKPEGWMATFSCPPEPQLSRWNSDPITLRSNNCYNYATNILNSTFAQPGRRGTGSTVDRQPSWPSWEAACQNGTITASELTAMCDAFCIAADNDGLSCPRNCTCEVDANCDSGVGGGVCTGGFCTAGDLSSCRQNGDCVSGVCGQNIAAIDPVSPALPPGRCLMGLVVGCVEAYPGRMVPDFHWFRRNDDTFWSHKPGGSFATAMDDRGLVIVHPESLVSTSGATAYDRFCGWVTYDSRATEVRTRASNVSGTQITGTLLDLPPGVVQVRAIGTSGIPYGWRTNDPEEIDDLVASYLSNLSAVGDPGWHPNGYGGFIIEAGAGTLSAASGLWTDEDDIQIVVWHGVVEITRHAGQNPELVSTSWYADALGLESLLLAEADVRLEPLVPGLPTPLSTASPKATVVQTPTSAPTPSDSATPTMARTATSPPSPIATAFATAILTSSPQASPTPTAARESATPTPNPTVTPRIPTVSKCTARKLQCVISTVRALLACHAKAEASGVAAESDCLRKAKKGINGGLDENKGCFVKIEAKENLAKPKTLCVVHGGRAVIEASIDAFVLDLVRQLNSNLQTVVHSKCSVGKTKCAGAHIGASLSCHVKEAQKGMVDCECFQRAKIAFDGGSDSRNNCFAKVEAKEKPAKPKTVCLTHGDTIPIEAAIDSFRVSIMRSLGANEGLCP